MKQRFWQNLPTHCVSRWIELDREATEVVLDCGMGSTLRNDTRAAVFLERLAKAWDKRGDLTFGQLLYEALGDMPVTSEEHDELTQQLLDVALKLRRLDNNQLAEEVERFVLTRS